MISAATRSRPANLVRANHHASGSPKGTARIVASTATLKDRRRGKRSIGAPLKLTSSDGSKAVLAQNALAFRPDDELQKPAGQVLSRALGHDSRGVTQGQMQRSLDELVLDLRRLGDRPCDDRRFGVAGAEKLGCLLDTFGEYELRLELVPEACMLQRLLGSETVGRMGRIGDGNTAYAGIQQTRQLRRRRSGPMIDGKGYASEGVYLLCAGDDFGLIAQSLDEALVGGEEDVDRGALLYLGGQTAAGAKDQRHPGAGLLFEGGSNILEGEPETAGGGDDQLILAGRSGTLAAGR